MAPIVPTETRIDRIMRERREAGNPLRIDPESPEFAPSEGRYVNAVRRRVQQLDSDFVRASGVKTDDIVEAARIREKTALPFDLVMRNIDELKTRTSAPDFDAEELLNSPRMARLMHEDPMFKDYLLSDLEQLSETRRLSRVISNPSTLLPMPESQIVEEGRRRAEERLPALIEAYDRNVSQDLDYARVNPRPTVDSVMSREIASIRALDSFVSGEGPAGPLESVSFRLHQNPMALIPYFSGLNDASKAWRIWEAAKAVNGGTANDQQLRELRDAARIDMAMSRRGTSLMGNVASILSDLPAFAGEFALTSGVYTAGKKALFQGGKGFLERATRKSLAATTGAIAQTVAASPIRIAEDAMTRMTGSLGLDRDDQGKLASVLSDEQDGFSEAIVKAFGSNLVEVFSERSGVGVARAVAPLKRAVLARWIRLNPREGVGGFLERIRERAAWDGIVGEVFEERVAGVGQAVIDGTLPLDAVVGQIPDVVGGELASQQLLAEAIAFAIPSAPGLVSGGVGRARFGPDLDDAGRAISRESVLQKISEYMKQSKLAKRAPESNEKLVRDLSEGSEVQQLYQDAEVWRKHWTDKGRDPIEEARRVVGNETEFVEALKSGGTFKIPIERYAKEISTSEDAEFFQSEVRMGDPGEMNAREARDLVTRLRKEAKEAKEAPKPDDAFDKSVESVRSEMEKTLKGAGFSSSAADVQSLIFSERIRRRAKLRSEDPLELFRSSGLTVQRAKSPAKGKLGRIAIRDNTVNIELFENANRSTFLHEMGHLWMLELKQDESFVGSIPEEARTADQAQFIKDVSEVKKFLEVDDFSNLTEAQQEKWAKGVERYLLEGVAPTTGLRLAFARIRRWLVGIYRHMRGLEVQLTDDVRDVMDRMLATQDEIDRAQDRMGRRPLFSDPAANMSPERAARYSEIVERVRVIAEEILGEKMVAVIKRRRSPEFREVLRKFRDQASDQLRETSIYKVIDSVRADSRLRINLDDAVSKYGEKKSLRVSRQYPDLFTTRGTIDGITADMLSDIMSPFGFQSGRAIIDALAVAPKFDVAVNSVANGLMRESRPDLFEEPNLDDAIESVHNEWQEKLLELELQVMFSEEFKAAQGLVARVAKRAPSKFAIKQAKDEAGRIVDSTPVEQINPRQYERAESKAAADALRAFGKGDIQTMIESKNRELLNHHLYLAAKAARKRVDKTLSLVKKMERMDEDVARSRDIDLVNAGRAVAAAHGLTRSEKSPDSFLAVLKRDDPRTYDNIKFGFIDPAVASAVGDYRKLQFGDFVLMSQSLEAIWETARSLRKITIAGERMDREEVASILNEQLARLGQNFEGLGRARAVSDNQVRHMDFLAVLAHFRKMEHWVDAMDREDPRGWFRKALFTEVINAEQDYIARKPEVVRRLAEILKPISAEISERRKIDAPEIGYEFQTLGELLHAIGHTGNKSNRFRLLVGRGWGRLDKDTGSLDSSAWDSLVLRLQREGVLRPEHYDAVQAIWDVFEDLKPEAQKAFKQRFGINFAEIEPDSISAFGKVYPGGYLPATPDARIDSDVNIRQAESELEDFDHANMFPATHHSFTYRRNPNAARPLKLDLSSIGISLDYVLKFIHLENPVADVGKLILHSDLKNGLNNFNPAITRKLIIPFLKRAATQRRYERTRFPRVDHFLNKLRGRASLVYMMGNVFNAVQNFTGVALAGTRVEYRYLRNASMQLMADPVAMGKRHEENSKLMATRNLSRMVEANNAAEQMVKNPTGFQKIDEWTNANGYFLQHATQWFVDNITFAGAYEQAIAKNGAISHEDAIAEAENTLRMTQGSFTPSSLSAFEAGTPFERIFTVFFGWRSMQANLLGTRFITVLREEGFRGGFPQLMWIATQGFWLPAVMSAVIFQMLHGAPPDDDDESYLDDVMRAAFWEPIKDTVSIVPGGREGFQLIRSMTTKSPFDDNIHSSPVFRAVGDSFRGTGRLAIDTLSGEDIRGRDVRDLFSLLTLMFGIPTAAVSRQAGYLTDLTTGRDEAEGVVDVTRGVVTGR